MTDKNKLKVIIQSINNNAPNNSCIIEIKLVNNGSEKITVNKRMAMGYKNSYEREIFVEIFDELGKEITDFPKNDYSRELAKENDYIQLKPGESITRRSDILEWYPLNISGKYWFKVQYQADEEMSNSPKNVVKGICSSNIIEIQLDLKIITN